MSGIGATLRDARLRQGREIAHFEARLKINARFLTALEDERWADLPGYPYLKAFLRSYGDMLGLDGSGLVDELKRELQNPTEAELAEVLPEPVRAPRRGPLGRWRADPRSQKIAVAIVGVAVIVVLAVVVAVMLAGGRHRGRAGALAGASGLRTGATNQPPRHRRGVRPRHRHGARSRRSVTPSSVALRLRPTGAVYVCLFAYAARGDADGQLLVNGILTPASPLTVYRASDHFVVTFGNDMLSMLIDGRGYPVAATPSVVASYAIARDGRPREIAPTAAPQCP